MECVNNLHTLLNILQTTHTARALLDLWVIVVILYALLLKDGHLQTEDGVEQKPLRSVAR